MPFRASDGPTVCRSMAHASFDFWASWSGPPSSPLVHGDRVTATGNPSDQTESVGVRLESVEVKH